LMIHIDYTITTRSAGPYANYAYKYLGLMNVATEDSISATISSIQISSKQEADPEFYYRAKFSCNFPVSVIRDLSSKGFIYDPLHSDYSPVSPSALPSGNQTSSFRDLSVKNFYYEQTDTLYKIILRDSVFVRLPVLKNSLHTKNSDEKAREAADLIIRLRNQRLNLLVPEDPEDMDNIPAEVLLKHIDQMEERYLTLFTGITRTEKRSELFCVIPDMKTGSDTTVLSSKLFDSTMIGPLTMVFSGITSIDSSSRNLPGEKNVLWYRMPIRTNVEIFCSNRLISQSYIYLSQVSAPIALPVKNLQNPR